jgi:hypothetical protein
MAFSIGTVEQVRELLELRGSTRGITSAVRLHGIFVSDSVSGDACGDSALGTVADLGDDAEQPSYQNWVAPSSTGCYGSDTVAVRAVSK